MTTRSGEPIGGSSNPGHGHGNTYRITVMGTYIFTPDVPHGRALRMGQTGDELGAAGPRHEHRAATCWAFPGTNGSRAFESGWPTFEFEDFATVGVNENFMPYYRHDPQSQYVVNFNWLKNKHNIRFGADFYHMGLNQAQAEFITGGFGAQGGFGFDRGITERCEAVDPATGNCEQTSDGSRYNSVGGVRDRPGQPRRQNAAGAGRVPRAGTAVQLLRPRSLDASATTSRSTSARGGSTSRFRPDPTAASSATTSTTGKVLLCGVGDIPNDCGIKASKTLFAPRVGRGLSHRRQVGRRAPATA